MLGHKSFKSMAAAAALAASLVLVGGRAQAQATGTGGTSGIFGTGGTSGTPAPFVAADFFIAINGPDGNRLTTVDGSRYFNLARCNCQTPVQIYVAMLESGIAKRTSVTAPGGTMSIILGPGCNRVASIIQGERLGTCVQLFEESVTTFLAQGKETVQTNARTLSVSLGAGADGGAVGSCVAPVSGQFTQTINVNFDFDGDGVIDLSVPNEMIVDLAPPPAPSGVMVQPGDEALAIGWKALDTSLTPDLRGYQILCSRADQYQVFAETATADGSGATGPFTAAFVSCPDARTGTGVEGLDPTFVCSPLLGAAATSARIEVLQNGITYAAAVVAVDQSGNASEPAIRFGAPVKTASFYDTYRDGTPPGAATGGYCAVGPAHPPLKRTLGGLSLLVAVTVGLLGRRRRRQASPDGSRGERSRR